LIGFSILVSVFNWQSLARIFGLTERFKSTQLTRSGSTSNPLSDRFSTRSCWSRPNDDGRRRNLFATNNNNI